VASFLNFYLIPLIQIKINKFKNKKNKGKIYTICLEKIKFAVNWLYIFLYKETKKKKKIH
jgi:hypothetical protein